MGIDTRATTRIALVTADTETAVEYALAERGCTVDIARSTDACLAHLSSVDCVVIGGPTQDADPVACCRAIREAADVPVVVFPADGSEALAGAAVAAGADGYVPRSQGVDTLTARLHALLEDRPSATRTATGAADTARCEPSNALLETSHELMRAESAAEIAETVMAAIETVIGRVPAAVWLADEETTPPELAAMTPSLEASIDGVAVPDSDALATWEEAGATEPTAIADESATRLPSALERDISDAVVESLGQHGLVIVVPSNEGELDDEEQGFVQSLATYAEAALDQAARKRELERTKTVVETVGDCVYQLDTDGRFVTVNETMIASTGYDRDELIGEHVSKILTDASVERGRKHVQALAADPERRIATYEVTLIGPEGERVPAEVSMALLGADGEIDGTVGIARDITDRKRMERRLVDQKAKIEGLHGVASRLDDCETRTDVYELTVEAAEDILDFDDCCADRVVEDSLVTAAVSAPLESDLEGRLPFDEGVVGQAYQTSQPVRIGDVTAADEVTPWSSDARSMLCVPIDDRGVFRAVSAEPNAFTPADTELAELLVSHVGDALDRISFAERLRAERDRFAALFENVPDAVVSARHRDGEPIVEAVNPAFERIFGYEEAVLVGEPLDQFVLPATERTEAETLNRRSGDGEIVEAEVTRRTANGLREFIAQIVPVDADGNSDRTFALYTDITAQKQRRKRLEILNRVLRHDLRNGMNIINGCAEMLTEAVEDGHDEYIEMIRERTNELIALADKTRAVEQVLDHDDASTGPIDFAAAVERAVARLEDDYEADIRCSIADETFARADEYLQTAVFQILENAVEHNDRDQPAIDVTLRDRPADDIAMLTIADDGPGIPAEERELLEGGREITQLRHGSGLGLWIVNWIVRHVGGHLSFADNDPRGTVVTLEVPRADRELVQATLDETATGD